MYIRRIFSECNYVDTIQSMSDEAFRARAVMLWCELDKIAHEFKDTKEIYLNDAERFTEEIGKMLS